MGALQVISHVVWPLYSGSRVVQACEARFVGKKKTGWKGTKQGVHTEMRC